MIENDLLSRRGGDEREGERVKTPSGARRESMEPRMLWREMGGRSGREGGRRQGRGEARNRVVAIYGCALARRPKGPVTAPTMPC